MRVTLAHYPLPDGRNARHRASADPHGVQQSCLCCNPSRSLLHGLQRCSLFDMQRQTWRFHMRSCAADIAQLSDEDFLWFIFMPLSPLNTPSLIAAHVHVVASVWLAASKLLSLRLLWRLGMSPEVRYVNAVFRGPNLSKNPRHHDAAH